MKSGIKMYHHITITSIVADIREKCKLKADYVNATFVIRRENYYIRFYP